MIRNVYFKAQCCNEVEVRYINDSFKDACMKNLQCSCGKNEWVEISEQEDNKYEKVDIKTGKLVDHRAYDKTAYMDIDYQRKRSQINDFHRERNGFKKFKE